MIKVKALTGKEVRGTIFFFFFFFFSRVLHCIVFFFFSIAFRFLPQKQFFVLACYSH
jgi:hypothetical protein